MKREILLNHECIAIAAKNGLAGLFEHTQYQHLEKGIQRGDATIDMDCSEEPTTANGFYFNPACGEGGVITATVGASHQENGLEGVRFLFSPNEAAAAQAALLSELRSMDTEAVTTESPAFTVV